MLLTYICVKPKPWPGHKLYDYHTSSFLFILLLIPSKACINILTEYCAIR